MKQFFCIISIISLLVVGCKNNEDEPNEPIEDNIVLPHLGVDDLIAFLPLGYSEGAEMIYINEDGKEKIIETTFSLSNVVNC